MYITLHSEWSIKIFFSGDYEYLCRMYGLSGASGKIQELKFSNSLPSNHQIIHIRASQLLVVHYSQQ